MPVHADPLVATQALLIAPSSIHGMGVFTRRDLLPDDLVECCPVVVCPQPEETMLEQTNLRGLYFHWEDDAVAVALGYGSLYNHAWRANARYEPDCEAGVVRFFAARAIAAGEEVTVNYTGEPDGTGTLWFEPAEPVDDGERAGEANGGRAPVRGASRRRSGGTRR